MAGIYMVIESWLNERTTAENRGLILSIYTTLTLVSISIGQQLMGTNSNALFIFAAATLSLFSLWAIWRIVSHSVTRPYFEPFTGTPLTTHEVMEVIDSDISIIEAIDDSPEVPENATLTQSEKDDEK